MLQVVLLVGSKSWDASTMELKISIISGSFNDGEVITGSTSGAEYEYQKVSESNTDDGFDRKYYHRE